METNMRTIPIFLLVISILMAGCASTHMKQYMGKDIREVIIDNGPPFNAFDMGDGRRAFQFYWGGGTYTVPQTTTITGSTNTIGNSSWYSGTAITTGGGTVTSKGCILTYFAKWDEAKKAWVITEYRVPNQLVC